MASQGCALLGRVPPYLSRGTGRGLSFCAGDSQTRSLSSDFVSERRHQHQEDDPWLEQGAEGEAEKATRRRGPFAQDRLPRTEREKFIALEEARCRSGQRTAAGEGAGGREAGLMVALGRGAEHKTPS